MRRSDVASVSISTPLSQIRNSNSSYRKFPNDSLRSSQDERQFWFHTITGSRSLKPPEEWVEYKEQLKLEKERNAHMRKEKVSDS